MFLPRPPRSTAKWALCLSWLGLAALPAHADVWGRLFDASTQQAFVADDYPSVELHRCSAPGDTLCAEFVAGAEPAADGSYRFAAGSFDSPGRYQLWGSALNHEYTHSAPFSVTGSEDHPMDMPLDLLPLQASKLQSCTTVDAEGFCSVSYTLRNVGSTSRQLQAWVLNSTTAFMPAGWSQYTYGDGDTKRVQLTLGAGKQKTLTQKVYVGKQLPRGAYASISLFVSPKDLPQQALIWESLPTVFSEGDGTLRPISAAAEQARALRARRHAGLIAAGTPAARPDAKLSFLSGQVLAADTGAALPLELAPSVRLMSCDRSDDEYCRWIEGDGLALPADGKFYLNLAKLPAGRYQIHALANAHYGMQFSKTFDIPGTSASSLTLTMPQVVVDLDDVARCSNTPVGDCQLAYTLRNTSARDQTVSLWLYLNALQSESQAGSVVYDIGKKGKALGLPVTVTLPAGQTQVVTQALGLTGLPGGSTGWLRLFVAQASDIAHAEAYFSLGNYALSTGDDGVTRVTVLPRPPLPTGAAR
ncbi:hypothetical protein LRH25_23220 [Ideonella azotifigens]|uniref:Uncharacterized protein n=3 Tax=Ideonella azotifigens TaxID=513160 RepID=A0ABN1JVQ9_9BURK|nr:hypothetical protein [Ideonella azotifigens]MCD2343240.1 hypothetical protein [Ideonella azotifigens]